MVDIPPNRDLTHEERHLVHWMLEHGKPNARGFLPQLEHAQVLPTRCRCGCASIDFCIDGQPKPSGGMRSLANFVFGNDEELNGIFVYEQSGVLSGVEVYGFTGDAPKTLPSPDSLKPFTSDTTNP